MKMIKLSDPHYIVVDDSKIKQGDWCIYNSGEIIQYLVKLNTDNLRKITHSTEPIDGDKVGACFIVVKPLTLSEVEEAINGYSVEKMAESRFGIERHEVPHWKEYIDNDTLSKIKGYIEGFKAAMKLTKDKLFTEEDMKDMLEEGLAWWGHQRDTDLRNSEDFFDRYIQSLLPKTEWKIEFDEQGKLKLI